MQPLYDFIVHLERRFDDEITHGTLTLQRDHRWDEFQDRVSYGVIKAVPKKFDTPAQVGDILVFHHHVNQQPDKYGMGDGYYMVTFDPETRSCQAFAVIKPSGEIITLANWVFLDAPKQEKAEETSSSGLFLGYVKPDTTNTEGVVCAKNIHIQDIKVGDTVGFKKNADYRITLPEPHGDVFRMHIDDIYYVKD